MSEFTPPIKFFTKSSGESVAYAVHGAGPALVVPAWWISHIELDWGVESYREFFLALGEYFTVVRYDRPGAGLSDRARKSFTLDDEVDTLHDVINHLELTSCTLLGVSCGGPPCITYALKYPRKIKRIVFIDSYLSGSDLGSTAMKGALCSLVSAHWGFGAKAILDLFDPDMDAETRQKLGLIHKKSASSAMAESLLKLSFDMDASRAVEQLDIPALVIHRARDKTVPFDAGRKLAAKISNSQFISVDGKAHLPWMGESAGDFIREIIRFTGAESTPEPVADEHNQFRKTGDVWLISYAGKSVHIKDSRGLNDLALLIQNQGKEINVGDLISSEGPLHQESQSTVVDQKAIQQYKQRLKDILEEKTRASYAGERHYSALEREEEQILDILKQCLGLRGQPRQFNHTAEKARKAVAARIRTALKKIISVSPDLGSHLQSSIKTGNFCSYSPDSRVKWLA